MKRLFTMLFLFFLLTISANGQTDFSVLYVNDTHSFLAPLGPRNADLSGSQGGIARAASMIGYLESVIPNTVLLHAGDFSIGDPFYFVPLMDPTQPSLELSVLKQLGFDAITLGNHEFDFGCTNLEAILGQTFPASNLAIPLLSANAQNIPAELAPYIPEYITKEFPGVKVGVFGLTTHGTNDLSNPSPIVFSSDFIGKAAEMTALLQAQGCNFIICLSHYGIEADKAIAAYVPKINLIVGGHDHLQIPALKVGETWISHTAGFYEYVGKLDFRVDGSTITLLGNDMIHLDMTVPEEPTIKAYVDATIAAIETAFQMPVYTQQIASSNSFLEEFVEDIYKPGNHSTPTGNYVADALKWITESDFAIEPGGSTTQPVYKGPIVPVDLFRIVGYGADAVSGEPGYRVVKLSITGYDFMVALETFMGLMTDDEFLPQCSGIKIKYVPNAPAGQKIQSIQINNKQINPYSNYTMATNYMVYYLLDQVLHIPLVSFEIEDYSEFEALVQYTTLSLNGRILPDRDARILAVKNSGNVRKEGETDVPVEFALDQNYPNPFNPSTKIKFSLPVSSNIRLSIFNILGEETAVLADGFKAAGNYEFTWDASSAPAGIYFYSLQAEGYSQTRKMILLK